MKKAMLILTYILFGLTILYPAGRLIAAIFGYGFELTSVSAFAAALAVTAAVTMALGFSCGEMSEKKGLRVALALLSPLSVVNALFYILKSPKIGVIVCMLISVVCCFYLTVRFGKPRLLKNIARVLSVLMLVPMVFLGFMVVFFGNVSQNTVVQTVASPDGRRYAQVTDIDQGALGGDILVEVYPKGELNALLFKIARKPQRVYLGDWGEFQNMKIHWKDDHCLVVNDVEYEIK